MNEINVNSVLAQIRSMQAQVAAPARVAPGAATQAPEGGFATVLKTAISEVNGAQNDAAALQKSFALGDPNVELSSVMLAGAKAQVQFKAMTEVRNRLVAAYQDIMNMPL
ncbi:flagellar hook-basal body complex protein FliE [Solimonas terrae]|uniref:Flagellar hook-basal body complex protein FliE n=1 Tax=Solimonas terrae TaxID=1396819 RepID=A0A6M2BWN5_9GAMM|nr:flagellar hook-basal body complex protein FliE [Solimonas terrae]NGY06918.1 flagellar hook-basal body complex protein FliE [Solimonas terrae]